MQVVSRFATRSMGRSWWLVGLWEETRERTSTCAAGLVTEAVTSPREQLVLRCRSSQECALAGQAIATHLEQFPDTELSELSKVGGRTIVAATKALRARHKR